MAKPIRRSARKGASPRTVLLVGTRKGAFFYHGDPSRRKWTVDGPHFLGAVVNHLVLDPRDGRTLVMAASTGHLGPTVYRSTDWGKSWKEAARPPAFPKVPEGQTGRAVKSVFWLTPGHASQPGVWWAGTSPQGLFRSEDGGASWDPVNGFNEHPRFAEWTQDTNTPSGPLTHSIRIDPRDPNRMIMGLSSGGLFESTAGGADWKPINKGVAADFMPVKDPEFGHDPHCVVIHPADPDRLYQQNHCGLYRLDRPSYDWERIGRNLPKTIGDIGFPVVVHPRDPDTLWVFPMDGTQVWPRTSPGGKPAVYKSTNGGRAWKRQDQGLPRAQGWFTVMRQAMTADAGDPVGLYFGATNGEIWASRSEGDRWERIVQHLPYIYSVETAVRSR